MSETTPSGDGSEAYLTFSARLQPIEIESTSTGAGAMSDREDTLQYLNGTPFPKVKELADGGDAAMRVELGIRHYTGCGTPEDRETAKQIWEATVKDETLSDADTPSVKRALLCLCALFQESYQTTGAIDDLLDAGRFANIVLGLDTDVSADGDGKGNRLARQAAPIALFTAQQLSRVRERLSGAERTAFDSQTADMLFLMDAFARRWVAIDASDVEGAQTKTAQAKPNPYECGRPGCGVVTQKLGTLRRCAGKCPAEVKPYYCSPECQKLDWKSHKLVCKPREPVLPSSTAKGMPGIGVKMPGVPLGRPLRPQPSTVPPESVKGGRDHTEQRAKDDDVD